MLLASVHELQNITRFAQSHVIQTSCLYFKTDYFARKYTFTRYWKKSHWCPFMKTEKEGRKWRVVHTYCNKLQLAHCIPLCPECAVDATGANLKMSWSSTHIKYLFVKRKWVLNKLHSHTFSSQFFSRDWFKNIHIHTLTYFFNRPILMWWGKFDLSFFYCLF